MLQGEENIIRFMETHYANVYNATIMHHNNAAGDTITARVELRSATKLLCKVHISWKY